MANNKVKEETPNPYNQNKSWHEGEDKPFVSSNSVYFEEPKNRLFESDDLNEHRRIGIKEGNPLQETRLQETLR
jgi:hypothetical protein